MAEKYLPIDVSSFDTIIKGNYVYVDKTSYIYDLFKGGNRFYFLSRPRRFGKTLLISTLKEFFSGNKKFFEGLWIEKSEYDWQEYPVIHLDFSLIPHMTAQQLQKSINNNLKSIANDYNVTPFIQDTPEETLSGLVKLLSLKNKVVLLIDEYDKPILDHLHDIPKAQEIREVLKSFYGTAKGLDSYLRAIFVTGVTRFSKTSLFSGFNNLNDISFKPEAAALLGCTQDEVIHYFTSHLENFAQSQKKSVEEILHELRLWYNGYQFAKEGPKVYNPFSLLYCLHDKEFRNYWYTSGNPFFLVKILRKHYLSIESVQNIELSEPILGNFDIENIPLLPLLFQAGYLTITDYNQETKKFKLNFPNFELEESFTMFLVTSLAYSSPETIEPALAVLKTALLNNDLEKFFYQLKLVFAHIPYEILQESYYHTLLQFLFSLLGLESQSEILTNVGRIDMVLITKTHNYIFELKLNKSAKIALKQINERKYYERYLSKGKVVVLVGLSFNRTEKALELDHQEKVL